MAEEKSLNAQAGKEYLGQSGAVVRLKTRVFEFSNSKYTNLTGLAQAMGISVSQIYRVRQGKRPISQKFIIGAIKAFPGYKLDDLFYVAPDGSQTDHETEGERKTSHSEYLSNH
ncbi:hypothetical protein ES703_08513 [subsurface metagenome]